MTKEEKVVGEINGAQHFWYSSEACLGNVAAIFAVLACLPTEMAALQINCTCYFS